MLDWFNDLWDVLVVGLADILPVSPIQKFLSQLKIMAPDTIAYINFFLPVSTCLEIFYSWLGALVLYYLWRPVLRLLKIID